MTDEEKTPIKKGGAGGGALLIASEVIPIIQKSLRHNPAGLKKAESALYAAYPEVVAEYLEHDPQHKFPGPEESHKGEDHSFKYKIEDGGKTAPQFDQDDYQPNIEAEPDMDADKAAKAISALTKVFFGSETQKKKEAIARHEERAGLETSPSKVGKRERAMLSQAGVNPKTMRHVGRRTMRSERPKDQAIGAKAARDVFGDKSESPKSDKPSKPKKDKYARYKSVQGLIKMYKDGLDPEETKYMASDAGDFRDPARDNLRPIGEDGNGSETKKLQSQVGSYGGAPTIVKDYKAETPMCPHCKHPYAECVC